MNIYVTLVKESCQWFKLPDLTRQTQREISNYNPTLSLIRQKQTCKVCSDIIVFEGTTFSYTVCDVKDMLIFYPVYHF